METLRQMETHKRGRVKRMSEQTKKTPHLPNKIIALLPIIFLLVVMISNYVLGWGQDPHIPVLLAWLDRLETA